MAPLPTKRNFVHVLALLFAAALGQSTSALSANAPDEDIEVEGSNPLVNLNAGTLSLRDVTLRQGSSTLISASSTAARGLTESYANSEWEFKGKVHIEFRGAVLDADSAVAKFADNRIRSIKVIGAPANFSHQLKESKVRNQGRAGAIDYDAANSLVRFAGNTWYSDGRNEISTATLVYNLNDGSISNENAGTDDGRVLLRFRPSKRIPTPRTPDRATAK
jgi:lipopolysaccharide transport protein LptA